MLSLLQGHLSVLSQHHRASANYGTRVTQTKGRGKSGACRHKYTAGLFKDNKALRERNIPLAQKTKHDSWNISLGHGKVILGFFFYVNCFSISIKQIR